MPINILSLLPPSCNPTKGSQPPSKRCENVLLVLYATTDLIKETRSVWDVDVSWLTWVLRVYSACFQFWHCTFQFFVMIADTFCQNCIDAWAASSNASNSRPQQPQKAADPPVQCPECRTTGSTRVRLYMLEEAIRLLARAERERETAENEEKMRRAALEVVHDPKPTDYLADWTLSKKYNLSLTPIVLFQNNPRPLYVRLLHVNLHKPVCMHGLSYTQKCKNVYCKRLKSSSR